MGSGNKSCVLTLCRFFSTITDMDASTQPLHVAIKRIDPDLPLPTYATAGSVAFDLYFREDIVSAPRTIGLDPSNVVVQTPPRYRAPHTMRSHAPRPTTL